MAAPGEKRVLVRNKRARHDYFVEATYEAGIVLQGSEVKSLRDGKGVISDAYVTVKNGEAWLINMQIAEYAWANRWNHAPKRDRKLLLKHNEIGKIDEATARQGYTALPLEIYLAPSGFLKATIGVCRGKKQHDKRQDQRKRDAQREVEAALKRGR
jgi:SsrA-binding protein